MIKKLLPAIVLLGTLPVGSWADQQAALAAPVPAPDRPWESIDVVLAVDTSGSMRGLIESAQAALWQVVGDLASLEPTPTVRVALLSYGGEDNDWRTGWVRLETGLTRDLDRVSERLFALTSEAGGGEYVARALKVALTELSWTPSDEALKLIFVAGNESADQDPEVSFRDMGELARRDGIFVQAIFCGDARQAEAEGWRELAERSGGAFAAIDHRAETALRETPFDEELSALGAAINDTYLPLGEEGRERRERLAEQDERVRRLSPASAAARAEVKASRLYSSGWDLVDAVAAGKVDLRDLQGDELPESLRRLNLDERFAVVEEVRATREDLRRRIAELADLRRRHLAERTAAEGPAASGAFASVVRRAIREKAAEKGFRLPE